MTCLTTICATRSATVGPSRPGEFHPESLTDPDMNLSIHPARVTQRKDRTRIGDRRRNRLRLGKGRARAYVLVCPMGGSKDSKKKEKMKKPLDNGRPR